MTDMTVAIVSVVVGFIVKEQINFFYFERYRDWAILKGKIAHALVFHASVFSNGELVNEEYWNRTTEELRSLASDLCRFANSRHCALIKTPERENLFKASKKLIGLSNGSEAMGKTSEVNRAQEIRSLLYIVDSN